MDRKLDLHWYSIWLSVDKKRENKNVRMWSIWWLESLTRISIRNTVGGASCLCIYCGGRERERERERERVISPVN